MEEWFKKKRTDEAGNSATDCQVKRARSGGQVGEQRNMKDASPIVLRAVITLVILGSLLLTLSLATPPSVQARESDPRPNAPTQSKGDTTRLPSELSSDVAELQRILKAMGYFLNALSGNLDPNTVAALESFQRDYALPVTGDLDEYTLAALGGSPETLNRRPRFRYTVRDRDTLVGIARQYGSSVPWILRLNPAIESMDRIVSGMELVVPIRFPIPDGFQVERVQVLLDRFLGTYVTDVPYTDVNRLEEQVLERLVTEGFEIERGTTLEGTTLSGRGVILGKLVFRAQQSNGKTRVDVALVFNREDKAPAELEPLFR